MKLIYHVPKNEIQNSSPFDMAIKELVKSDDLNIACPYIDIDYLKDIINGKIEFKILTDVEQWIQSTNQNKREEIVCFLKKNQGKIHHYPGLHAKVVASNTGAIIGSANLTMSGLYSNNEFSILVDSEKIINEIREWFDLWWTNSEVPNLEEVIAFSDDCNKNEKKVAFKVKITSKSPKINIHKQNQGILCFEGIFSGKGKKKPNIYVVDGKEKYEVLINKKYEHLLPVKYGERIPINLVINDQTYEVGLNSSEKNIWISPDTIHAGKKVRLTDIVELHGIQRNQKVKLRYEKNTNEIIIMNEENI
ncbi:phospholipase D-like domain-containing protein [Haliscomenobacter hydrossis]|uniref:Phospholipase D-like domain-containing protein n=1 Tax=Haliscomenobacter hydrossis (strain ATCC 27775 / DSM 1100 / LMG 10767 / O) TaxID=760192 RepID=F4KQP3_HALH1|nr:phospholipase D-like domain-containing protein [Haliscomenobacter hydrossis]AEE51016.1 hypothetical protein Halhy_3155 [Haliscomenobacter hydrossis DSM 1100]